MLAEVVLRQLLPQALSLLAAGSVRVPYGGPEVRKSLLSREANRRSAPLRSHLDSFTRKLTAFSALHFVQSHSPYALLNLAREAHEPNA
jgi:hypothetical protein